MRGRSLKEESPDLSTKRGEVGNGVASGKTQINSERSRLGPEKRRDKVDREPEKNLKKRKHIQEN